MPFFFHCFFSLCSLNLSWCFLFANTSGSVGCFISSELAIWHGHLIQFRKNAGYIQCATMKPCINTKAGVFADAITHRVKLVKPWRWKDNVNTDSISQAQKKCGQPWRKQSQAQVISLTPSSLQVYEITYVTLLLSLKSAVMTFEICSFASKHLIHYTEDRALWETIAGRNQIEMDGTSLCGCGFFQIPLSVTYWRDMRGDAQGSALAFFVCCCVRAYLCRAELLVLLSRLSSWPWWIMYGVHLIKDVHVLHSSSCILGHWQYVLSLFF